MFPPFVKSMGWLSSSLGNMCALAVNASKFLYPGVRVNVPMLLLSKGIVQMNLSFQVSRMQLCLVMQEWL